MVLGMRTITTQSNYWQIDCWDAAEADEPFFMEHLQQNDVFFLKGLEQKFRRPVHWGTSNTTFLFNPPKPHFNARPVMLNSP